jgi:3-hydroxymyristoyl/3-hydroxydecanoyl-(acyl carrier protein) dehydratase
MILPHRSPFLMVDSINMLKYGQKPSISANFMVKQTEPLYAKNESDTHWPSIYIIEGLGQCCNLLIVISAIEKELRETGLNIHSMDEILRGLMDVEPDEVTRSFKEILHKRLTKTYSSIGFLGSADVEITGCASQGQVVSYEVQLNQAYGSLYHSTVRAFTDNNLIARGTLVSAGRKD